jgi:hypothetical protein
MSAQRARVAGGLPNWGWWRVLTMRRGRAVSAEVAERMVQPCDVGIEGRLTKLFELQPFSDVCPMEPFCDRRRPRHSMCAGIPGSPAAEAAEIGIACECRFSLWLIGEGDLHTLTPGQWKRAVVDFAADLGHQRRERGLRREARTFARCVAALRQAPPPQ